MYDTPFLFFSSKRSQSFHISSALLTLTTISSSLSSTDCLSYRDIYTFRADTPTKYLTGHWFIGLSSVEGLVSSNDDGGNKSSLHGDVTLLHHSPAKSFKRSFVEYPRTQKYTTVSLTLVTSTKKQTLFF